MALLLMAPALALLLFGIVLYRFRLFDRDKKSKISPSRQVGKVMIIACAIVLIILILVFIAGTVTLHAEAN